MRTKRTIVSLVLLACIAGGALWAAHSRANPSAGDIILGPDIEITDEMQQWIDQCKGQAGAYLRTFGSYRMLLVARGEMPTAGYGVKIEEIGQDSGRKWIVDVTMEDPGTDSFVAQVISYPYVIVAIKDDHSHIAVRDVTGPEPVEIPLMRAG